MLTVVLANYNHARFLPYALEGLIGQTRPADELIIIDDASTDDSASVIEPYLSRHPHARLVRNASNQGIVRNMNAGLAMARGTLVYFAAADDIAYPRLFEVGVPLLDMYPQAALFSARSDIIEVDGTRRGVLPTPVPITEPGFIAPAETARFLLRDDGWFMGNSTIYRCAPLNEVGGFPEELNAFTDGYISRLLAVKHGACYSPEVLCAWRRMAGGVAWSQSMNMERTMRLIAEVERRIAEDGVFPNGYAERWKRRYLFGALRFSLSHQNQQDSGVFRRTADLMRQWFLVGWWFLRLRPWDLYRVVQRRVSLAFDRSARAAASTLRPK